MRGFFLCKNEVLTGLYVNDIIKKVMIVKKENKIMKKINLFLCLLCVSCMIGMATNVFAGKFSDIDNLDAPDGMKKADLFKKYKSSDSFGKGSGSRNKMAQKMRQGDSFGKDSKERNAVLQSMSEYDTFNKK